MPNFLVKTNVFSIYHLAKPLDLIADDAGVVIYDNLCCRKSGAQRAKGQQGVIRIRKIIAPD